MSAMSGPAIFQKDGRTYKVFGLTERAAAISKVSAEMDTIISDRMKAAKAALEHWGGPHAGTFVDQVNAVLAKMAALKLASWEASARLSSFPVPLSLSVDPYYDRVYAGARVAPARPVGTDSVGAEPGKLRQYVKVASGQDERFATLARTVTLDGVSATVAFPRALNAAEIHRYLEAGVPRFVIGDLQAQETQTVRNDLSLPPYVRDAAAHLLDSPTLVRLAAGGGKHLTRDGIRTFVEMNQTVRTVDQHFALFDTAAKGGKPDGFVSNDDLKATANDQSLDSNVRQAAQWLLDHPEQLLLLGSYSRAKYLGRTPDSNPVVDYRGFARQDLIGRIVDGQAYGDNPQAAERFVNSLPVADHGRPGLPIWLCSTDGVKALANASLISAHGDLTDQQSVIAHLPETKDAIRNELITAYYEMLGKRVDKIFAGGVTGDPSVTGHPGANWLIYAPWASNGVHDVINGKFSVFDIHPSMSERQNAADGNQWIFNDVTARFAAFAELYKDHPNPSTEQLERFFQSNFHDGDAQIRTGFAAYVAATRETDPARRQALMFQGNILVATHEQAGVQPYLEGVGNALVPNDIEAEYIDVKMGRHRIEVNKDIPNIAGANNLVVGMKILDLDTGGRRPTDFSRSDLMFVPAGVPAGPGVVHLDDISGIQGFPTSFTTWHRKGGKPTSTYQLATAWPGSLCRAIPTDSRVQRRPRGPTTTNGCGRSSNYSNRPTPIPAYMTPAGCTGPSTTTLGLGPTLGPRDDSASISRRCRARQYPRSHDYQCWCLR
jgi:hypothetical protein